MGPSDFDIFSTALSDRNIDIVQTSELQRILSLQLAQAEADWPGITLPKVTFLIHLANSIDETQSLNETLESIHFSDLYLACCCGNELHNAIAAFETAFFSDIKPVAAKYPRLMVADVEQVIRERLFTSENERQPRVLQYTGRGKLRTWFRMTVVRTISNLNRGHSETPVTPDYLADRLLASSDPEMVLIRNTYLNEFRHAFSEASRKLSKAERRLLHHSIVDELSIDQIAAIYNIHRATAARRLTTTRDILATELKKHMTKKLGVQGETLHNILGAIRSRVDLTMERYLLP